VTNTNTKPLLCSAGVADKFAGAVLGPGWVSLLLAAGLAALTAQQPSAKGTRVFCKVGLVLETRLITRKTARSEATSCEEIGAAASDFEGLLFESQLREQVRHLLAGCSAAQLLQAARVQLLMLVPVLMLRLQERLDVEQYCGFVLHCCCPLGPDD
jgi:hypothetical protein